MKYTDIHISFLREHGTMSEAALNDLFNATFGTNQTGSALRQQCAKLRIFSSTNTGRFKKGDAPVNKGTKGLMKENKTSFKKGNAPHNTKVVGSITKIQDKNGYWYMRIKIAEPNKWQMLHAYIWEHKYGKIPKGSCVIFKDKNPLNLRLDNLMLVSRNELVRLNQKYPAIDKSLKEVALQVIKIQHEVTKNLKEGA
jgi:hypothetical protein